MNNSYKLNLEEVVKKLNTNINNGLTSAEATKRLEENGPNELVEQGVKSPWLILWEQLTATMVIILIFAAIVSAMLADYKDAIAIMAIVVLNALLGLSQELKAEKAIAALKKLAVPSVKVRRDGTVQDVSARELVTGDIVLIEAGNIIPADCRILESANLKIQEAALTGESDAVEKKADFAASTDLPLGDRINMAYMGTVVTYGRGQAIVDSTGMNTELGKIATLIQNVNQEPTPLQKRLDQVGKSLLIGILVLVSIIFVLGLLRGEPIGFMMLMAVSLAVAAIPEALPAVVTITLALGSQRMLKRHALIRKLPAVETLGSITVICSDKTGTLTENRMTVTMLDVAGDKLDLTNKEKKFALSNKDQELALLLVGGALCTDVIIKTNDDKNLAKKEAISTIGDPTENALVIAAANHNIIKPELEKVLPRVAEVPFDSERKRMTTIHKLASPDDKNSEMLALIQPVKEQLLASNLPYLAFTKGAVDGLLHMTKSVIIQGKVEPLTDKWRERIMLAHDEMTQTGKRVLGIAFRLLDADQINKSMAEIEQDLVFIGMMGMIDPARPEVKDAVAVCKSAGIHPIMITGDHPLTAQFIAKDLGITSNDKILTGQELDKLSVEELNKVVNDVAVYARVAPEHKLKIVQALQNNGHVVAMTGDGVNDAPALKKADIGVAMGITGTDVSKEASDMVLTDDNFATIVAAVEEGRVIYDNIKKYIKQTLTGNLAAIWVTLIAPIFGLGLPLQPLQILWLNLVADGLPSVALGLEPAEQDIMKRPPNYPNESIFSRRVIAQIVWGGLLVGSVLAMVGYWYKTNNLATWQTMILTTLIFSRMNLIMAVRSNKYSLFQIGILSNKPLLGAVSLTILMQIAITYVPFLQKFFDTVALSLMDLAICVALSLVIFVAIEIEKFIVRATSISPHQTAMQGKLSDSNAQVNT
ncbi:MAG: cation-translocating P-type ATPase [Blastocatellia bacterium]|nr:cation-translocating P-type ATPase [Blastocatellia bacterium]